jgi:hypothetical protein
MSNKLKEKQRKHENHCYKKTCSQTKPQKKQGRTRCWQQNIHNPLLESVHKHSAAPQLCIGEFRVPGRRNVYSTNQKDKIELRGSEMSNKLKEKMKVNAIILEM